jgi:two-component system, NarL family, response regulator LiaR
LKGDTADILDALSSFFMRLSFSSSYKIISYLPFSSPAYKILRNYLNSKAHSLLKSWHGNLAIYARSNNDNGVILFMNAQTPQNEIITVLLADDHPITRAGIRATLSDAPDILVIGEAESGFDVQKLVAELRPRILLLDLQMPGPRPADLERWVRQNYPAIETIVLTAHGRDPYLAMMVDAGASGFLSKHESGKNLIVAIRRAANGENLFSDEQMGRAYRWRKEAGEKWDSLSEREREVLGLMVKGMNNAVIAENMKISPKTVAFHITNVLKKLGVKSRSEANAWVSKYAPINLE